LGLYTCCALVVHHSPSWYNIGQEGPFVGTEGTIYIIGSPQSL